MNRAKLNLVCNVVELELGVLPGSICSASKKREHCTARTAFLGLLEMVKGFNSTIAANYLNRSRHDVNHIRRNHHAWLEVNPEYVSVFERVRSAYKTNLPGLSDVELLETKEQLETDIKKRGLQLIRVLNTLQERGISIN